MAEGQTTVSGEPVVVLGPKPEDWEGLGQTYTDAVLVRYPPTPSTPNGEVGAVPRHWVKYKEK